MYFVLCILPDGTPGRLIGPFDENDQAIARLIELVEAEKGCELDADTKYNIEMDGLYTDDEPGGFFVIMSE